VNGQRAVYLPIFKAGADSNTIAIVNGVREKLKKLYDVPATLKSDVVFDQSRFVKTAIETLPHEGGIGWRTSSVTLKRASRPSISEKMANCNRDKLQSIAI
jgi:multidrug efflux pump subunit AcrB